jgi:hypothetical protein
MALAVGVAVLGSLLYSGQKPSSPLSPLKSQAVQEEFDNLDGEGEIKWYEYFFTWNPRAQVTSYPFITRTIAIDWRDEQTQVEIEVLPDVTAHLVVELELRGDGIYTQTINTEMAAPNEPGEGTFYNPTWVWINIPPGNYEEWIRAYWQVSDGSRVYLQMVEDGAVIAPDARGFVLNREVAIPTVIYLPMVMRRAE